MLINIIGGDDLTLGEATQINDIIHDAVGDDAEIIFGAGNDPAMHGEVRVTVIATGFDRAVTGEQTDGGPGRPRPRPASSTSRPRGGGPRRRCRSRRRPSRPRPSRTRPSRARRSPRPRPRPPADVPEMEIPTFIRRQMD